MGNSKYVLLCFSITCKLCIQGASCKICFTLLSIVFLTFQETSTIFQRGQQVTLLVCDWWILIHFSCFPVWLTIRIVIDGSVKRNYKFGFKLQSSHVNEKRYKATSLLTEKKNAGGRVLCNRIASNPQGAVMLLTVSG